jgi:ComEC/Rec2-related protein
MTTRIVSLALGLVSGIVVATFSPRPVPAFIIIATGALGALITAMILRAEWHWKEWPVCIIVLAAFLCGFPIGYFRTQQRLGPPLEDSLRHVLSKLPNGTAIGLRGTVCAEPEPRGNRRSDLRICATEIQIEDSEWQAVRSGAVLVRAYTVRNSNAEDVARLQRLADPEAYGYRVEVHTQYRHTAAAQNPGEFDFPAFLRQRDLLAWLRCHVKHVKILNQAPGQPLVEIALWAKRRFLSTYKQTIRSPASRLVAAATLGTRRAVENINYGGKDIAESFRHAGVGHVLAVSGLHVSIVALLFYSLFRLVGLRPRVFAPLVIILLILFSILTGARPSSVRAVIMSSVILVLFAYLNCNLRKATAIGLAVSASFILLRNPIVLYSPGFLLSYGAVLSLVILVPPVDRLLCSLRGYSFLFFLAWAGLIATMAGCCMGTLLDTWNWIGLGGLLALLLQLGSRLNERFPSAWKMGLAQLPRMLRFFVGAQLAIQIGMMVPLSAWFFGRFPISGALVNLLAIPAVGVLVQLGMLTGMLGLVPWVGQYLALPFGAADTLVGEFFLRLAHTATLCFPFPSTPKPSIAWMIGYYVTLLILVLLVQQRTHVQALWYRVSAFFRRRTVGRRVVAFLPLLLTIVLMRNFFPREDHMRSITCLATGPYPVLTAVSSGHSAITVNGGDHLTGERVLFEAIRHAGGTVVDTAIVCGPQPQSGYEGLAALSGRLKIRRALLPVVTDDPKDFIKEVGDTYLARQLAEGERWARRYEDAYANLHRVFREKGTSMERLHAGSLVCWEDFEIRRLRWPERWPRRFVTSAKTALLEMNTGYWRWLVVTESLPETVDSVVDTGLNYDVLVLPDLSSRRSYRALIDRLVERANPRLIIFCGNRAPRDLGIEEWAAEHGGPWVLVTGRDGAITASIRSNKLVFRTWVTGKRLSLPCRGDVSIR